MISHEALSSGFTRLLSSVDDLVLDVPEAVHLLALFTGRAVVDELLPPAFLTQVGFERGRGRLGGVYAPFEGEKDGGVGDRP